MNEEYPNYIYVWDLDRADSLFHARATIAQVAGKARASAVRTRESGVRFTMLDYWQSAPPELKVSHFSSIETLEAALRDIFTETDLPAEGGLNMFVQGLPDTVRMIQAVLTQQRCRMPIEVTFQRQPDGTRLG